MTKRAVIYARVSYDDRANEDRNLESQIEDGRAYCQERGYRIVTELAEDDRGASGADWNLPKLNEALDLARTNGFDVLVVRELDRFARGLAKQLVIEGEFKRHGVEVEYILADYEDSPEGKLNKNIRAVIAEYEREKINQRMTRGRRRVVKEGRVLLHGVKNPPYGYRVEDGTLSIYGPEAKIVRLMFTWYVTGDGNGKRLGVRSIVRRLTEMSVPTWVDTHGGGHKKSERGKWNRGTVTNMLKNETYAGTWHYGKRGNGREHWLAVEVPAIVSREVWAEAQERLEHNKAMAKRNAKYEYLVGKRVSCGKCACKMVGCSKFSKQKLYLYYTCRGYELSSKCEMTTYFRADEVDRAVWEKIKEWLQDPEVLEESLEKAKDKSEGKNQPLLYHLSMTDELLAENRRELERLLDIYLSSDLEKEMFLDRKKQYEDIIASLEKERADLTTQLERVTLTDEQIETIVDFARKVASGLEEAEKDFEARRRIIEGMEVGVRLVIEDGVRVAYVRWLVGGEEEERLSVEKSNTSIAFLANRGS